MVGPSVVGVLRGLAGGGFDAVFVDATTLDAAAEDAAGRSQLLADVLVSALEGQL